MDFFSRGAGASFSHVGLTAQANPIWTPAHTELMFAPFPCPHPSEGPQKRGKTDRELGAQVVHSLGH